MGVVTTLAEGYAHVRGIGPCSRRPRARQSVIVRVQKKIFEFKFSKLTKLSCYQQSR